jgi:hypothetical protein
MVVAPFCCGGNGKANIYYSLSSILPSVNAADAGVERLLQTEFCYCSCLHSTIGLAQNS